MSDLERTAAIRTFDLPELLEQILINLSQRELLLTQRVSQAFHQTISASPKLQRALFFSPDPFLPSSPITYLNPATGATSAHSRPQNNRLLLRAFPGVYPTVSPCWSTCRLRAKTSTSDARAPSPGVGTFVFRSLRIQSAARPRLLQNHCSRLPRAQRPRTRMRPGGACT